MASGGDIAKHIAKTTRALEKSVSDEEQRKRLTQVGLAMKPLAQQAARADLGSDAAFSGWANAGIPLEVAFKLHRSGAAMTVHRSGKSAGPWTVAERGRNQGNAAGFSGPGMNHRTGATSRTSTGKIRNRKTAARRWTGTTKGKSTFSNAVALMEKKAPDLLVKLNRAATLKAFRGG